MADESSRYARIEIDADFPELGVFETHTLAELMSEEPLVRTRLAVREAKNEQQLHDEYTAFCASLEDEFFFESARQRNEVGRPVLFRSGAWVVTGYGVECLYTHYPIEVSRLGETDWTKHMREKVWVGTTCYLDFCRALYAGLKRKAMVGE